MAAKRIHLFAALHLNLRFILRKLFETQKATKTPKCSKIKWILKPL